VVGGLLTPSLATASQVTNSSGTSVADEKISEEVRAEFAREGTAGFWVLLTNTAKTARARTIDDWTSRGQRVVDSLQATAEDSQARVRAVLDARGLSYQSFWITNAILVQDATWAAAAEIAAIDNVAEIRAPQTYEKPDPVEVERAAGRSSAVEWGVANVNADDVWSEFGTRGEGIVVANIDSGVQFDHPALAGSYRGNNGDGTFEHDYNWLDVAGACEGAPCDANQQSSHGTHTMGTMIGDDGAGNQIGVAPGARWIAANGCARCTDVDLIASAQWMLAPTDAAGGNPDVSKRPHIINNSWGSRFPSNDPFMEDVITAWADAGIFGIWANGNNGSNCSTSSSPGSRTIAYSVGAYDINNNIAPFSSRGPGQGGETKPNISAPGLAVRSAQQNDFYGLLSGTSMATPHAAGAIALLWSADPTLIGDIEGTRTLLDLTAVDAADDQCGGEPEDNNVYGEGRLDALALLEAGSGGGTGTLTGTVTDAETGEPVRDARITATGPIERATTTANDGTYSLILIPGEYDVTVGAFGYEDSTVVAEVVVDETTPLDVELTALETVDVDGAVLDGSGHGWPLYARITVVGEQLDSIFTDPYTGEYSLELPSNSTYTLRITPQLPGYEVVEEVVETGVGELRLDLEVPIDAESCNAPGYDWAVTGASSSFDEPAVPEGWSVTDNNGAGGVWRFDDPGNQGNRTGGTGGFAIFDGTVLPDGTRWDSTLMTPVADLTDVPDPVLTFNIDYTAQSPGIATGEIDLSLDGGQTWANVWRRTSGGQRRQPVQINLPQAAGEPEARIRFRYTTINTGWWQIDDVVFGVEFCAPVRGGLVAGQVSDANTDAFLAGAEISGEASPEPVAVSATTPNDPALPDGFYWLFSSGVGAQQFTARRAGYEPNLRQVNVAPHWVTRNDFVLEAGLLVADPESVSTTQTLGDSTTRQVTFTNEGTAPVDVELREEGGNSEILTATAGASVQRVEGNIKLGWPGETEKDPAEWQTNATPAAPPWTAIANYPIPIMDNSAVTADDGTVYSIGGSAPATLNEVRAFDPDEGAWSSRGAMAWERARPAAAYINGRIYVVGGWWTSGQPVDTLEIYNPAADSWTTGAPVPVAFASSAVGVVDETMYVVGGCSGPTGSTCGHDDVFAYETATDTWRRVADYPEAVSYAACGGIGNKLYCAGGTWATGNTNKAYVYDPEADDWAPIADMPLDLFASGYTAANGRFLLSGGAVNGGAAITNEGIAYDPAADEWSPIPNSNEAVFRGGSACGFYKIGGSLGGFTRIPRSEVLPGFGNCGSSAEIPWLTADTTEFTLDPDESIQVTLTLDAGAQTVDQPGTYTGRVTAANDSPYALALDLTMNVEPPEQWGKVAGAVAGERCDGSTVPLPGATIAIDSRASIHTLRTDADGRYALWLDQRHNPLSVIAGLDGWRPEVKEVEIRAGETTNADFVLFTTTRCDAPQTRITSGPSGTVTTTDASFEFTSNETESTFECSLDDDSFDSCSSPQEYNGLGLGAHTFRVRATDASGNIDPTPAERGWTIEAVENEPPTNVSVGGFAQPFAGTKTLRVGTSASDPDGIDYYDVSWRIAPYDGNFTAGGTRRSQGNIDVTVKPGSTACFSATATDTLGATSGQSGEKCVAVPVNDRALERDGSWKKRRAKGHFLGSFSIATQRGATLVLPRVKAKRLALVATTCKACGTVQVFAGKNRLKTIKLTANDTRKKQVINIKSFKKVTTARVKIVVTSRGKPVRIEGLGVSRT
jgi:subtilisin family serine protease/N-acetylneuraminic acid mutarotase